MGEYAPLGSAQKSPDGWVLRLCSAMRMGPDGRWGCPDQGQCTSNAAFMSGMCAGSCKLCAKVFPCALSEPPSGRDGARRIEA